jgi:hypothetical protein
VIHGLGNGAYWDPGRDTVVVLVSGNVFEVVDDVPANLSVYPGLASFEEGTGPGVYGLASRLAG